MGHSYRYWPSDNSSSPVGVLRAAWGCCERQFLFSARYHTICRSTAVHTSSVSGLASRKSLSILQPVKATTQYFGALCCPHTAAQHIIVATGAACACVCRVRYTAASVLCCNLVGYTAKAGAMTYDASAFIATLLLLLLMLRCCWNKQMRAKVHAHTAVHSSRVCQPGRWLVTH